MEETSLFDKFLIQLQKGGFTEDYAVKNLFPYWWDDSLKKDDCSVTLLLMEVADLLNVELDVLWNTDLEFKTKN